MLLFATNRTSRSRCRAGSCRSFGAPSGSPRRSPTPWEFSAIRGIRRLADFPTEFHSNWQWYELLDHSRSIILDDTPAEFRPIVQVIDNFARNHKLGTIFEARVGAGRLLVCGIDLPGLGNQPAARQLLASLERYAGSEAFRPAMELPIATLDKLFATPIAGLMRRLGAKIVAADSQAPDYEAAHVIDGDPDTIWHTPWEAAAPGFPHHLIVEFARPVALRGLKVLPRQDMPNGRIKDYQIFVSNDGKDWGRAVKKGAFADSDALQLIQFTQPVKTKYLKFTALSSFEKRPYASMAELEVITAEKGK